MSEMMRAVVMAGRGDVDVFEVRTVARPAPATGQILVRVASSGINRADLLQRRGGYPVPEGYPEEVLGLEYAGTVEAVGDGVDHAWVGRAVMGITGGGGYAEYVVEAAETAVAAPGAASLVDAGAIPEVFMTAFDAVLLQEGLRAGETLLVHAVGSGVGTAAVQLARRIGARTIGTSRTPEKLERARGLGLDVALPGDEVWADSVLEVTDGRGADVILDLVGGAYLAANQRVLARGGRHIVVGVPSGAKSEVDLRALMGTRGSIRGTILRARPVAEKAALARAFERDVLPGFDARELRPVVDSVFPADRVAEAHTLLESNVTFGKVLLTW